MRIDREARDEEERRRLAELRRKEEQVRVDELFAQAARWDRCRQTREYLKAVRVPRPTPSGEIELDSNLDRWLRWAEDPANRVPSSHRRPEGNRCIASRSRGGGMRRLGS